MPFLGAALPLIGAATSAAGSVMGGIAQQNQANYQAKIAERNAMLSSMEGATALQAGQEKATETSLAGAERLGRVKTEMAAGGVDINRGSAVNVRASQRMAGALATATTMWNAERSAWGYGNQAIGEEAQARAERAAGQNALFGGILGGVGDIVGGLGKTFAPGTSGFLGAATPTAPSAAITSSPGDNSVSGGAYTNVMNEQGYSVPGP